LLSRLPPGNSRLVSLREVAL